MVKANKGIIRFELDLDKYHQGFTRSLNFNLIQSFEIHKMTKPRIVLKGEYSENQAIKMKWKITIYLKTLLKLM